MNNLFNPGDYGKIAERISKLQSNKTPAWGKMSVNQMVCHVSDPFRDLLKKRSTKPVIPFFLRPLIKWMLIGKKPFGKNTPTVKPYSQTANGGGTKPANFEEDVSELKNLLHQFVSVTSDAQLGNHAALGAMTRDEAGAFMWKHLDHHLRQFGV